MLFCFIQNGHHVEAAWNCQQMAAAPFEKPFAAHHLLVPTILFVSTLLQKHLLAVFKYIMEKAV